MASPPEPVKKKRVQFQGASNFMDDIRETSVRIARHDSEPNKPRELTQSSGHIRRIVSGPPYDIDGDWFQQFLLGRRKVFSDTKDSGLDEADDAVTTPTHMDGWPKKSEVSITEGSQSIVQQADPGCKSPSQLESDADAKQRRINKAFMNLKIAEKVPSRHVWNVCDDQEWI